MNQQQPFGFAPLSTNLHPLTPETYHRYVIKQADANIYKVGSAAKSVNVAVRGRQ